MRIDIVETKVFQFAELSDAAKESALESLYNINTEDSFWYECVIEQITDAGKMLGIDIDNVYFSGFSSQGDGAQFTGSYSYAKQSSQAIKAEWPKDSDLQLIADGLRELQRKNFYSLSANVSTNGHYSHEMCTDITVYDGRIYSHAHAAADTDDSLSELLRDFMRWSYRRLETEHEWLSSTEMVRETIECNEYEFTESGDLH